MSLSLGLSPKKIAQEYNSAMEEGIQSFRVGLQLIWQDRNTFLHLSSMEEVGRNSARISGFDL